MKIVSYSRVLLVAFTLTVLFSFNLSIPQLVQHSEAYPSAYVSEIAAKNNPFYKTGEADQLIYDYFPSSEKKESDLNMNEMVNQLMNSLVQEKVARPEICGDGQDNDGNGQVDEYCNVSNIPQDGNQSPQVGPEQEICGDGQDNDGNGQVDENCNVTNIPQDDKRQEMCRNWQQNNGNVQVDENCNVNNIRQGDKQQEMCRNWQQNNGNVQVDENCNVTNIPQDGNQSPQVGPEQEICGDGQDNDGNGQVDENCNVTNIPQDGNQSPQVGPEQEICGDGQDNDGNGQVDENCNVTNIPQDNSQSSDGKKNFDKFGVLKIYPTKKSGEQWYLNSNPNDDPRYSPQTTLTKNSDGSFKVKSTKVRMGVFTSSGFHPEKINTLNHNKIAQAGYMQSPNDWRDVEITGYVKLKSVVSGNNDNFVWYARGGRHTGYGSPQGCEGVAYKGGLFYGGATRWEKEQWHTGGYVFAEFGKNIGPIKGKWVGLKVIMYNIVQNGKTAVKLELWVDKSNNNNWIKATEKIDKGGWGNNGMECGGKPDQIITWGGPIAAFRWDGATDVDIKKFSVREIVPQL
jgi:Putative metal-binding motif